MHLCHLVGVSVDSARQCLLLQMVPMPLRSGQRCSSRRSRTIRRPHSSSKWRRAGSRCRTPPSSSLRLRRGSTRPLCAVGLQRLTMTPTPLSFSGARRDRRGARHGRDGLRLREHHVDRQGAARYDHGDGSELAASVARSRRAAIGDQPASAGGRRRRPRMGDVRGRRRSAGRGSGHAAVRAGACQDPRRHRQRGGCCIGLLARRILSLSRRISFSEFMCCRRRASGRSWPTSARRPAETAATWPSTRATSSSLRTRTSGCGLARFAANASNFPCLLECGGIRLCRNYICSAG